jgi:hypothetical protein
MKEVSAAWRQILASYDWDYRAMMLDMMKRQWENGHKVVAALGTVSPQRKRE